MFLETGLGIVSIGDPAPLAFENLSYVHGAPTEDTGWGPAFSTVGACPSDEARLVRWGSLEAIFIRPANEDLGPWTFAGGADGSLLSVTEILGEHPQWGYPTLEGVRVGDTVSHLVDVYQDRVTITDGFSVAGLPFALILRGQGPVRLGPVEESPAVNPKTTSTSIFRGWKPPAPKTASGRFEMC